MIKQVKEQLEKLKTFFIIFNIVCQKLILK